MFQLVITLKNCEVCTRILRWVALSTWSKYTIEQQQQQQQKEKERKKEKKYMKKKEEKVNEKTWWVIYLQNKPTYALPQHGIKQQNTSDGVQSESAECAPPSDGEQIDRL